MIKQVIKYSMADGVTRFSLPVGAVLRSVQNQRENVTFWFETTSPMPVEREVRTFQAFGTGEVFDNNGLTYVATVVTHGGNLVLHVYEDHR